MSTPDLMMPYSIQLSSVPGSRDLVILPTQRSPQSPSGTHHYLPTNASYMMYVAWDGPEGATLTVYTNGSWQNPRRITAGSGQRTSAPYIFSAVGANPRLTIVLSDPAVATFEAVVNVIPQEPYKP